MDIILSIRKTMAKKNLIKFLIISWSLILGIRETNAKEDIIYNIHKKNFSFESIDGGRLNLSDFEGKVILISNTASFCGFTNQYKALQEVYDKYEGKGFTVIAIPSGDFMQEYEDNSEVKNFCRVDFSLTFPIAEITKIIGNEAHPFYKWLEKHKNYKPRWNFNKILISPSGNIEKFFGSMNNPNSEKITNAIEEILP
jgi:glutathione peroxidase